MKILITYLCSCFALVGLTQESPKADPFKKPKSDPDNHLREIQQVVCSFEIIDVSKTDHDEWKNESLSADELRSKVEKKIESGKAEVVESTLFVGRSGGRAKSMSSRNVTSPSEWEVLEFDPEGPLFPFSQKRDRECGFVSEIDPVILDDGKIKISFQISRCKYIGEDRTTYPNNERVHPEDTIRPRFSEQKVTTNLTTVPGEYSFLGAQNSLDQDPVSQTMIFLRTDIQNVLPDLEPKAAPDNVKLRCEWVEVPADQWHRFAYQSSLNEVPLKAWEWASRLMTSGIGKSVCSHSFITPSGQRSKLETTGNFSSMEQFLPPTVIGGNCKPTKVVERHTGFVTEIDPVRSPLGNFFDLNHNPEYTYQGEDFVSYRKKVDNQWIPAVTAPNLHTARIVSQLTLPSRGTTLCSSLSPCLPDGSQDSTRKYLVFWHNATFD